MCRSLQGAGKLFVDKLLTNLSRRFSFGYKQTKPYNCLTLLDIRHADLYFSPDDVNDLAIDDHFDEALIDNVREQQGLVLVQDGPLKAEPSQDSFSKRRAQLLAAKQTTPVQQVTRPQTFKQRLETELSKFLKHRGSVGPKENPNAWWRDHHTEFPLLSKYWISKCAFPATATSAEQVFNMDGLVLSPSRKRLDPDRTGDMVICRDYWMSREGMDERFSLCSKCPQPPSPEACYKISCSKHNKFV